MRCSIATAAFLLAAGLLHAQHGSTPDTPFSTPADAAEGAKSFRSQCAACHGLDGSGGVVGPNLISGSFKSGGSDEALYRVITKGVPGTAMTGFPLGGREVWQLIAFLRSASIGKGAEKAKGDAAKGAQVFESSGCIRCHTNGSKGGFAGPDLSDIGSHRSLSQLETAILDPNADVAPDYWSLRAKTKSGQTITGIRMNEDMTSFQIRESSGRLRSVWKSDLASYDIVKTSPMPSFKDKLSRADLENLVAYLASLRVQTETEEQGK